jgi:hypothetical protein
MPSSRPLPRNLALPFPDPSQHVVETTPSSPVTEAPAEHLAERVSRVGPGEYRVAHLVDRAADVERKRERVRPVDVAAVPVVRHGK